MERPTVYQIKLPIHHVGYRQHFIGFFAFTVYHTPPERGVTLTHLCTVSGRVRVHLLRAYEITNASSTRLVGYVIAAHSSRPRPPLACMADALSPELLVSGTRLSFRANAPEYFLFLRHRSLLRRTRARGSRRLLLRSRRGPLAAPCWSCSRPRRQSVFG